MIKKFAETKKSKTDNLYSEISDTEGKANKISSAQNDKNEMTDQQRKDYDRNKLEIEVRNKNVPLKEDDRKKTTVADETVKITAEDIRLKRKQQILDDFRKDYEEYEEFSKLFNKIKKLERIVKEDLKDSEAFPKLLTNFSPNLLSTSDHASLTECTAFSRNDIEERIEHRKSPEDRCGNGARKTEVKFSKYLDGNRSQKKKNQVIDLEPQSTKEYVERGEKLKESRKMETMSNMKTQTEKAKSKKIAEVLKNLTKIQDARFKDVPREYSTVSQHGGAQNEERALSKLSKEYLVYLSKKEKSEMTDQERSDYYQFKREHKARKEKKRLLMETTLKLRSAAEKVEKFNGKRNREAEPNIKMQSKRTKLHKDKNEMTDQEHRVFNYYKRKLTDRNKDVPLKQVDQKKMKVEKVTETSRISAEDLRRKRRQRILDDFRKDDEVYEEFSKVFEQIKKIPRTTKEKLKNQPTLPETATELSQNPLSTNDPATLTECAAFSRNDIGAPYKCIYPFLGLFRPIPNVLYGGYESFDDFLKDFGTDMRFKGRLRRQLGTRYRTEEIDAYFEQIRIESELREGWTYRPSTVGVPFGCKKQSSRTAALWKKD
ncbi:hypothetical protein ACOME3_005180 [Neoechinorhynchus agilis]